MGNLWAQKRVALLCGGHDSEREISLKTGAAFRASLQRLGIETLDLDFDAKAVERLALESVDVALIGLHGRIGEGGAVQGLLECLDIPYTGSGVLASSLAMDKVAAKCMLRDAGIPTPDWMEIRTRPEAQAVSMPGPVVIKPPCEGSSVGIVIARNDVERDAALEATFASGNRALVESYIEGRELSVGFFDGEVLGVMEIVPATGVYDFEAKYARNDTQYLLPAPLSDAVRMRVESVACGAWNAIGCRGVGRVDILLDAKDQPWVLELNTIPGMTPTSIVPKMAAARGWSFDDLVIRMLDAARTDVRPGGE